VAALIAAPFSLKPHGIYLLSMWAVMSIAAIGLNLTLGYAGQISLAAGGVCRHRRLLHGDPHHHARLGPFPRLSRWARCSASWSAGCWATRRLRVQHHYLAFVTLAFTTLVFLVLRNEEWLTKGIYGIVGIPRPTLLGWSTKEPRDFYYLCLIVLGLVSWLIWHLVRSPWGRAFMAYAREPGAGVFAGCRYAALHPDGVRDRLGAGRRGRFAVCAAGSSSSTPRRLPWRCRSICC